MKYKESLRIELEKRTFELVQVFDSSDNLPWWIEEKWVVKQINTSIYYDKLIFTFLTERSWENGTKLVERISVGTKEMSDYSDTEFELLSIDMRKGNFDDKLEVFWQEFNEMLIQ